MSCVSNSTLAALAELFSLAAGLIGDVRASLTMNQVRAEEAIKAPGTQVGGRFTNVRVLPYSSFEARIIDPNERADKEVRPGLAIGCPAFTTPACTHKRKLKASNGFCGRASQSCQDTPHRDDRRELGCYP